MLEIERSHYLSFLQVFIIIYLGTATLHIYNKYCCEANAALTIFFISVKCLLFKMALIGTSPLLEVALFVLFLYMEEQLNGSRSTIKFSQHMCYVYLHWGLGQ